MPHRTSEIPTNRLAVVLSTVASLAVLGIVLIVGSRHPVHAAASDAPRQPVLVELFTSEGCSSCPPADALLAQLDTVQAMPGAQPVIVLSEHVTYWNHGGWHDPFSNEIFTERQHQYSSRFGLSEVYTPQAVVDGAQQFVGSDRGKLVQAIQSASAQPKIPITLENAQWSGDTVTAQISTSLGARVASAVLFAALADDSNQSSVLHGENQGRNLRHVADVRSLVELRKVKDPLTQQSIQIKLPSGTQPQPKMRLVVFLSDPHTGHVLGAAVQTVSRQNTSTPQLTQIDSPPHIPPSI